MSVLVTGGAGATGLCLVRLLEAEGHAVHTADARPLPRDAHTVGDLASAEVAAALVASVRPAIVFHLAGSFSNDFAVAHPANVLAARAVLEAVRLHAPTSRVVVVGSAAEYGLVPRDECPIAETRPLRPVSVYGLTKSMQSTLVTYSHAAFGLDVVLARTFNLKGRGLPEALLPGRLDREIARKKAGEIEKIALGSLGALRDYLTLEEAARAYLRLAEKGASGEVYNVGSGVPVTMRDYVRERLAEDGLGLDAVEEGAPAGGSANVLASWADVTKLHQL